MIPLAPLLLALAGLSGLAEAHIAFYHPSMWGFNVTQQTFSYDNRPMVPLMAMSTDEWWFHNYLAYPPNDGDVFELPAGGVATAELACDKGLTTWWNSSDGGNIGYPTNNPCLGQPISEFHTTGINDLGGCALSIAYNSDANSVQPDDFTVFSINQTCVWNLNTDFPVPADMPACPAGGCICQWHWIHSPDSGAEQMYLIPFRCEVTGASGTTPIGQQMLPRRCGADPNNGRPDATPGNCTIGPKYPMYWYQTDGNNMFEGTYSPPLYLDLYNFQDGAQDDIFQDAYISSLGPGAGASAAPTSAAASSSAAPAPTPTPAPSSAAPPASSDSAAAPSPSSDSPSPAPSDTPSASPAPSVASASPVPSVTSSPVPSASAPSVVSSAAATPTISLSSSNTQSCRARPTGASSRKRSAGKERAVHDGMKRHRKQREHHAH